MSRFPSFSKNNILNILLFTVCGTLMIEFLSFPISKGSYHVGQWIVNSYVSYFLRDAFSLEIVFIALSGLLLFQNQLFHTEPRNRNFLFIFSGLISVAICFGKSFQSVSSWSLIFGSIYNFVFSFIITLACTYVTYHLCRFGYGIFIIKALYLNENLNLGKKYAYFFVFVAFAVLGLFYLFVYYPGATTHDGAYQIAQYLGYEKLNNHHPVVSTLLSCSVFYVGKLTVDANFGMAFYNIIQILFQSFVFTECVQLVGKLTRNKNVTVFVFSFLFFTPLFPTWGITFVKDTIYYISFLWFLVSAIKILENLAQDKEHVYVQLTLSALLATFYRNNGFLVIILSIIFLAWILWKSKNYASCRYVGCSGCIVMMAFLLLLVGLRIFHITTHEKEALSIPIQQLSRVVYYQKPLDEKDQGVLYNLFGKKNIGGLYNPEVSDPVKSHYIQSKTSFKNFMRIYFKYMKRYPSTYLEAFLNQTYGYLYPMKKGVDSAVGVYGIPRDAKYLHADQIKLYRPISDKESRLRQEIRKFQLFWSDFPGLGLLYNCSFYIWVSLFVSIINVLRKNNKIWVLFLPVLLNVIVCFLSPVDACIRYLLPVIAAFPLLVSYSIYLIRNEKSATMLND